MNKHPGFNVAARQIVAKSHGKYNLHSAGAILAHNARHASPHAIKANPRLKRVRGAGSMY